MGESNSASNYRPLIPSEEQYYVLNGEPHSVQLLFSGVDYEYLNENTLLQPQLILPPLQVSSNNERQTVINSVSEVFHQVIPKAEPKLNLLSDINILQSQNLQPQYSFTTEVQGVRPKVDQKNVEIENRERTKAIRNSKRIQAKHNKEDTFDIQQEKKNKARVPLQIYFHIADREIPPRALAVLPTALVFRQGHIFARRPLPPRIRFGPVHGSTCKVFPCEADDLVLEASVAEKPVFLMRRDEESVTHINVSDNERSNWFSLLPLGTATTANVWLYEHDNELYGLTTKIIPLRTPLTLGYSRKYSEDHKLPGGQPVLDLEEALSEHGSEWWCFECRRGFVSSTILQRHVSVYHREKPARRRYRCACCSKAFSRISSLRRHTAGTCPKKLTLEETSAKIEGKEAKDPELILSRTTEESRLPSDESFQIYTTGLDISTNLFDPDKIANLDISGSSKSEIDFNSYSGALKFDLDNDYKSFSEGLKAVEDKNKDNVAISDELVIVSCPHCDQTMTKAKKRRHLRECSSRKWVCECERVFRRKQDLAQHIFKEHKNFEAEKSLYEEHSGPEEDGKKPEYNCDACKTQFKRRGMLVNHLWRVHGARASLPVVRRIRHYPCAACPRLYRSASKRDAHARTHHPGINIRAAPIEGERKTYKAATCPMCPRQYVTRAKLLQHMRAAHSDQGAPAKPMDTLPKSSLKTKQSKPSTTLLPRTGIL